MYIIYITTLLQEICLWLWVKKLSTLCQADAMVNSWLACIISTYGGWSSIHRDV